MAQTATELSAKLQDLQNSLEVKNNLLQISESTFTSAFSDFLFNNFHQQDKTLQIQQPKIQAKPEAGEIVVTGVGDYLQISDMPLTATFSINEKGELCLTLVYTLVSQENSNNFWSFSRSFPNLPLKVIGSDGERKKKKIISYLDDIEFSEAYLVVSSHPYTEPDWNTRLRAGINLIAVAIPGPFLGILENLMNVKDTLTLVGYINIPRPGQEFITSFDQDVTESQLYPWEYPEHVPGIHINLDFKKDVVFGQAQCENMRFVSYCPLADSWQYAGNFFKPVQAFQGEVQLGKNSTIDLILEVDSEAHLLTADARCKGVTLDGLQDLMIFTGSSTLTAELPASFEDVAKAWKKIELTELKFVVSWSGKGLLLDSVMFALGIPDFEWKVWDEHVVVDSIGMRFQVDSPFDQFSFCIVLWGKTFIQGVEVDVEASHASGWILLAKFGEQQTLPLRKYMKAVLPDAPTLPNLTIDDFSVIVAPGLFYQMSGALAELPKTWNLKIGPADVVLSDITFDTTLMAQGTSTASFSGVIELDKNLRLESKFSVPGDFSINANLAKVNLLRLIERVCSNKLPLPENFDLVLEDNNVVLTKVGSAYKLSLMGTVKKFGILAFDIEKQGNQWGVAAGLDLQTPLSKLPGCAFLKPIENLAQLENLLFIISTFDGPDFEFPESAHFGNYGQSNVEVQLPRGGGGLAKGLNVYGKWCVDTSKRKQKLLKALLGLNPELEVVLQVGSSIEEETRLFTHFETTLQGKHHFDCKVGLAMTEGEAEFFVAGSVTLKIQKRLVSIDAALAFVEGGAVLAGSMQGSLKFGSLILSDLNLMIGVDWAGIPSLGIAATLDVKSFESSLAIFIDSTDPGKSLLAGAVSNINLSNVATTLGGIKSLPEGLKQIFAKVGIEGTLTFKISDLSVADALDHLLYEQVASAFQEFGKVSIPSSQQQLLLVANEPGKSWHLTDLTNNMKHYQIKRVGNAIQVSLEAQFYMAPETVYIGSARYQSGVFVNGCIDLLGLKFDATVDINPLKGISIDTFINKPLVIGNKTFLSITDSTGNKGPRVSAASFKQPDHKVKEFRPPHFYFSGKFQLLGVGQQGFANISDKGLAIELKGKLTPVAHFDISVTVNHSQGFSGKGDIKVGLGKIDLGKLGKVKIDTDVEAKLGVGISNKKILATVSASFEALGKKHKIARFTLNVKTRALAEIGSLIEKEAAKVLREFFKDAGKWAKAVGDGAVEGVDDVEKVLKKQFGKTGEELEDVLKKSGLKKLGKSVESAEKDVGKTVNKGVEAVGGLLSKHKHHHHRK